MCSHFISACKFFIKQKEKKNTGGRRSYQPFNFFLVTNQKGNQEERRTTRGKRKKTHRRSKFIFALFSRGIIPHGDTTITLEIPSRELKPEPLGIPGLVAADPPEDVRVGVDHRVGPDPRHGTVVAGDAVDVLCYVALQGVVGQTERGESVQGRSGDVPQLEILPDHGEDVVGQKEDWNKEEEGVHFGRFGMVLWGDLHK